MRYAGTTIKVISLILISILFVLFLIYATGFGEDGDMVDLAMSNVLVSAMILVLIVSGLSSIAFDYYERNKYQNEEIFNSLNEKIAKLEEIEPKINAVMAENTAKTEQIFNALSQKIEENSRKTQEYMIQFANLSVQVFAKDKQTQKMEHKPVQSSVEHISSGDDYFNHYTSVPKPLKSSVPEPDITDKVELPEEKEVEEKSVDDILREETAPQNDASINSEDRLSEIFNDELADTLSELEIMRDEKENSQPEEVDLSAYFNDSEKIKL